ncbi:hypothetical protein CA13_13820 [Planctomycetes bacterium CA13]|uniref:Uncharacterized protein n=1 Tax=Novipirellula herctigrandis TaxID=2527986 RepID=A0A5C5YYH1_9BACT|nr:hypothetical protein CA13_13820 [Planctomycetes bacterium CA13]
MHVESIQSGPDNSTSRKGDYHANASAGENLLMNRSTKIMLKGLRVD